MTRTGKAPLLSNPTSVVCDPCKGTKATPRGSQDLTLNWRCHCDLSPWLAGPRLPVRTWSRIPSAWHRFWLSDLWACAGFASGFDPRSPDLLWSKNKQNKPLRYWELFLMYEITKIHLNFDRILSILAHNKNHKRNRILVYTQQHWHKQILQKTQITHFTMATMKLQEALLKYFYVMLRLFQIIKSQSFQFKPMKENAPVFTALLLFKAWQNFTCKIILFPKNC